MATIRARPAPSGGDADLSDAMPAEATEDRRVNDTMLLDAALEAFVEKGFHGTSMRDIARRAGTSVSHSYYYFPSKHHILWLIVSRICQVLLDELAVVEAEAGPAPDARLAALVRAHVLLHARAQSESFVGNSELRSLHPQDRPRVIEMRDRISRYFRTAIEDGLREGRFRSTEPAAELTLAVVTMCTAVAGWYRPGGGTTPEDLADHYAGMVLRMVGATS
ncbi:TetR/AcrR family transcriptional regulator [Marinibaculum pumilum]|uniref:TetR/AcrR family transcriptional regulator n=1 Tax=Marinibaculum pumilum TaxID=1766165 RepID=A0ABV7LA10_9PROT